VLSEPDAFLRASRLANLLPTLGPDAVPTVAELVMDPSRVVGIGATETELLVRFWATYEPAAATRWALFRAPLGYRVAAVVPAIELWARADPEAAAQQVLVAGFKETIASKAAQVAMVRGWLESDDPGGLVDHIRDLGVGFERQRALAAFARGTIQHDGPEAIMRWAESLPDEPKRFKLAAYRQVGSELAMLDLDAALRWCESHCEGPFGGSVRRLIATRWAAVDGLATLEWLSTAPSGLEREVAVRTAFNTWASSERAEAFSWLAAHGPDGFEPWLRPAVVEYAKLLSAESPPEALKWAELIEDDEEREFIMVWILRRWRGQDEGVAEEWLQQSALSEEAREKARSPARVGPRSGKRRPAAARE
jgi:hypothetical protein